MPSRGNASVGLATALRDAGLDWSPAPGDCFVMPDRGMDDDVFVLSNMTIEVQHFPTGPVIGFNGTTEWALDSVEQSEALWLPAEHQLRERLGPTFVALVHEDGEYRVTVAGPVGTTSYGGADPAEAYGRALLDRLTSGSG